MWSTFVSVLCSPFILRFITLFNSDPENGLAGNSSSEVNDPRILCRVNSTTALFYPHSKAELRGCYEPKPDERGPCGDYMLIYPTEEDETVGECDCDRKFPRTLIYHEESHQCYPIFQQGYCPVGKWLDLSPEGRLPVCERNPCYKMSKYSRENAENMKDLVLMNGACVEVGSSSNCPFMEEVGFIEERRLPTCTPAMMIRATTVPGTKCRPGTYRALSGRCQPALKFNSWDFEDL